MSLMSFALSLAALATLRPPVAAGAPARDSWPTIAGMAVFDNELSRVDDLGAGDSRPMVLLGTTDERLVPAPAPGTGETLSGRGGRASVVLSVITSIGVVTVAGDGYDIGIAGSDREAEAYLSLLDHQVTVALRASSLIAALSPIGITGIEVFKDYRAEDGRRLAAHRLDFSLTVWDEFDAGERVAAGSAGPRGLAELVALLPDGCRERQILTAIGALVATPAAGYDDAVLTLRLAIGINGQPGATTATVVRDPEAPAPADPINAETMDPHADWARRDWDGAVENDPTEPHVIRPL